MNKKLSSILIFGLATLVGCNSGTGGLSSGSNYYVPSPNYYYTVSFESSTGSNTATLTQLNSSGNIFLTVTLNQSQSNPQLYTYRSTDGYIQAVMSIHDGNMGFAIQNTQNTNQQFSDFATQNNSLSIPDGNYISMCNVGNFNPCIMTVTNNVVNITQLINNNGSLSQSVLCTNVNISSLNNLNTPGLYTLNCGNNGNPLYVLPITINGKTGFLVNENSSGIVNGIDDGTDDIIFPLDSNTINPSGNYDYVYTAYQSLSQLPQNGLSAANFNGSQVNNLVMGMGIPGQLILMTYNTVFLNNVGFNTTYPINTLTLNSGQQVYNLVGNDTMNIYQDNFTGIYY